MKNKRKGKRKLREQDILRIVMNSNCTTSGPRLTKATDIPEASAIFSYCIRSILSYTVFYIILNIINLNNLMYYKSGNIIAALIQKYIPCSLRYSVIPPSLP